jgi:putative Mg2+ transporter-C (MgtC) family protein
MREFWEAISPKMDLAQFVSGTILKLIVAALLGGCIGLERELKQKAAGLRTNMFICFGACMFTILSFRYSEGTLDRTRIAAQVITGIGFLGAGAIMHSGGTVSGITTAATIFVVASVGMAVGGGEYLSALFATIVILVALTLLGRLEARFNFKQYTMNYEVAASDPEKLIDIVNGVLDECRLVMKTMTIGAANGHHRIQFTVDAKHRDHMSLVTKLQANAGLVRAEALKGRDNSE